MPIGPYRINLDALLARLLYRWRYRSLAAIGLLLALMGLASGRIPPLWRGRAELIIQAAPGATVQIDGRSWPRAVYAGCHTLLASLPDGRRAWADVELTAGQALTLTLPAGLPEPRERLLPPAAPATQVDQIWWADGAWRITSAPDAQIETPTPDRQGSEATPGPRREQTVAIDAQGVERLPTLDAYAGLADQAHVAGRLIEAVYRPGQPRSFGDAAGGAIEVRGWSQAIQTVPISVPVTLLRLSPNGSTLLEAEQAPGGVQVYLIRPDLTRAPLVATPGQIARLSWRSDGSAVVIHSVQDGRLTLTLVRLEPTIVAATIADLSAAAYPTSIVPLTWDDAGLLWVAPDEQGISTLWRAPIQSLTPERSRRMDARALTYLPDGTLRAIAIEGERVVIGRYQGDLFIGETIAPHVPAAPDLMGMWQGDEVLLQSGDRAWLLDVREEGT